MVCIYCRSETNVINSRAQKRLNHVWRRRKCSACKSIFTTSEAPQLAVSVMVHKASRLEPFSRDKLFLSIYESSKHRTTALSDAQALTETVIGQVMPVITNGQVPAQEIARAVRKVLKNFDLAAHTHYAAFHP